MKNKKIKNKRERKKKLTGRRLELILKHNTPAADVCRSNGESSAETRAQSVSGIIRGCALPGAEVTAEKRNEIFIKFGWESKQCAKLQPRGKLQL